MKTKGFTLIELLMVIAVVSLLSTIVLGNFNNAREKGRIAAGQKFGASLHHAIGDELVGEWLFDQDTVTSEVVDTSGWGNDATYQGGASFSDHTAGIMGQAINLSGGKYLDIQKTASDLGINGNNSKTVTAWVYTRGFNNGGIFELGTHLDGRNFCLRTLATENRWRTQLWGGGFDIDFTYNSKDRWVFFALIYDGTEVIVYADGVEVASRSLALNTGDGITFVIGRYGSTGFDGDIDDVRIYRKALTTAQIQKHYVEGLKDHSILASN